MAGNKKDPYVKLEIIVKDKGTKYFVQSDVIARREITDMQYSVILLDLENGMSLKESLRRLDS